MKNMVMRCQRMFQKLRISNAEFDGSIFFLFHDEMNASMAAICTQRTASLRRSGLMEMDRIWLAARLITPVPVLLASWVEF
jgi:hypothetical protein